MQASCSMPAVTFCSEIEEDIITTLCCRYAATLYQNSYLGVEILLIGIIYLPNEPATIGSRISICLSDAC